MKSQRVGWDLVNTSVPTNQFDGTVGNLVSTSGGMTNLGFVYDIHNQLTQIMHVSTQSDTDFNNWRTAFQE